MGNVCQNNCYYDCCDLNYNCTYNISNLSFYKDNCYYYYYNWAWVYWVCGVILFLFVLFAFIGVCLRRRRRMILAGGGQTTMILDNTQLSYRSPMMNNNDPQYVYGQNGGYVNGQGTYINANPNQGYNNQNQNPNMIVQGKVFFYSGIHNLPAPQNQHHGGY